MLPRKIFDYHLPPIPFAVYCYLLCCHNKTKGCYPSRQTIAKACGISDSSTGRAIKQLEKRCLILVKHNFGNSRQQNNSYEMLPLNTPSVHGGPAPSITQRQDKTRENKESPK